MPTTPQVYEPSINQVLSAYILVNQTLDFKARDSL